MPILNNMQWSFAQIWNESLEEGKPQKPMQPRDRIWASEVGGSMIDRWLKMKGAEPSNPPNPRSLRKFEAGNIWECIVGYVLKRAGILLAQQDWLKYQYEGLLPVVGKLDFKAGGKPDYDKASHIISNEFEWLPPFISRATQKIVDRLKTQYPDGLAEIILELKSCSSFMYEMYERKQTASPQHKCQLFHYLKSLHAHEGHIIYVSKDDARLLEIGVLNPSSVETDYYNDIKELTGYITSNIQPPLEQPIKFDNDFGKFSANWKVGYSSYLTKLYGLKCQKEFDDKYKPIAERWNRVLSRITESKDMTDKNKTALEEMTKAGFNIEEIKTLISKEAKDETAKA